MHADTFFKSKYLNFSYQSSGPQTPFSHKSSFSRKNPLAINRCANILHSEYNKNIENEKLL